MVKRISCRVISTAAFSLPPRLPTRGGAAGKTSAGSSSVNQMNNRRHESGGIAAADIRLKCVSIPADNPKSFDIGLEILNGFPIGRILDYYA